jgi:hypothetical protein
LLSSALLCPSFVCVQSHRNHRHVLHYYVVRTPECVCVIGARVCVCFFRATGLVFFPTFVGTHQTQLFLFCFLNAKEFAACAAAACVIGNSWVKYFSTTTGRRLLLVVVVGNSTKLPVLIYWPAGHTYTHTHTLFGHPSSYTTWMFSFWTRGPVWVRVIIFFHHLFLSFAACRGFTAVIAQTDEKRPSSPFFSSLFSLSSFHTRSKQ